MQQHPQQQQQQKRNRQRQKIRNKKKRGQQSEEKASVAECRCEDHKIHIYLLTYTLTKWQRVFLCVCMLSYFFMSCHHRKLCISHVRIWYSEFFHANHFQFNFIVCYNTCIYGELGGGEKGGEGQMCTQPVSLYTIEKRYLFSIFHLQSNELCIPHSFATIRSK